MRVWIVRLMIITEPLSSSGAKERFIANCMYIGEELGLFWLHGVVSVVGSGYELWGDQIYITYLPTLMLLDGFAIRIVLPMIFYQTMSYGTITGKVIFIVILHSSLYKEFGYQIPTRLQTPRQP